MFNSRSAAVNRSKRVYCIFVGIGVIITCANLLLFLTMQSEGSAGHHSSKKPARQPWWRTGAASWSQLKQHPTGGTSAPGLSLSDHTEATDVKPPATKHPRPHATKLVAHLPEVDKNEVRDTPTHPPATAQHHGHAQRHRHNVQVEDVTTQPDTHAPEHVAANPRHHLRPQHGHNEREKGVVQKQHEEEDTNDHPPPTKHPRHHKAISTEAPPSQPPSPPPATPRRARHGKPPKYVAKELGAAMPTANITFDEALGLYDVMIKETLNEELEQSSNKFRDIAERSDAGVELPTSDEDDLRQRFGIHRANAISVDVEPDDICDPRNADYTTETDDACLRYLRNVQNMYSIKPMSSFLSTGRTIKFKLYYKHRNITAVLKVSQKKFALEPASEVISFYTDRYLQIHRVPPVAWTSIPLSFLKVGSSSMDAFYAQWFHQFVVMYDTNARHLLHAVSYAPKGIPEDPNNEANHQKHKVDSIKVSIQLWMADVRNADETSMRPSAFKKYLGLPLPVGEEEKFRQRLAPTLPNGDVNYKSLSLAELSDEFVFDAVIGNSDRWFGHNSFALGGCEEDSKAPCSATAAEEYKSGRKVKSLSTPRLAFIDQGSAFYRSGVSDMNPFYSGFLNLCRFRRKTAERIVALYKDAPKLSSEEEEAFLRSKSEKSTGTLQPKPKPVVDQNRIYYDTIRGLLPPGIFMVHSVEMLRAAGNRLAMLEAHIRSCSRRFPHDDVFYF